jgi:ribosomal protein S18 acetylase RimI-like enzyme
VEAVYRVKRAATGGAGLQLVEEKIEQPFERDYDRDGEENPCAWARQYDLSRWGIFAAIERDAATGGAAVALEGPVFPARDLQRPDLAVLWDIRVHPDYQRRGIGKALFKHAAAWAKAQGYNQLGLETDGSNIPACRFYAKMGCELGAILKYGYSGVPEVAGYPMLLWYLDL